MPVCRPRDNAISSLVAPATGSSVFNASRCNIASGHAAVPAGEPPYAADCRGRAPQARTGHREAGSVINHSPASCRPARSAVIRRNGFSLRLVRADDPSDALPGQTATNYCWCC